VKLKDIAGKNYKSVRWHEHLPDDLKARAKAVYRILGPMLDLNEAAWVDEFCLDLHPDREIAVWERYAECFQNFTSGKPGYCRAVAWKAILNDIANTEVVEVENIATHRSAKVKCPFIGSAAVKVWENVSRWLRENKN